MSQLQQASGGSAGSFRGGWVPWAFLVLVFFYSTASFWQIAPSVNDSIRFANSVRDGLAAAWGDLADVSAYSGRPDVFKILTMPIPYLVDSLWYLRSVFVATMLLVGILFAHLMTRLGGNRLTGWLCFGFYSLFLQNDFEFSPTSTLGFPLISLCFLLASLCLFAEACIQQRRIALILSVLLFFTCLITYELYYVYLPLFPLVAVLLGRGWKEAGKASVWHLVATGVAFAIWLAFRLGTSGSYPGTEIQLGEGLLPVLRVACSYALWAVPGTAFFSDTYEHLFTFLGRPADLGSFLEAATGVKPLLALAFLGFAWREGRRASESGSRGLARRPAQTYLVASGLLYLFLAPSMLPALTRLYQESSRPGYLTSFYSLFPIVVGVALALQWVSSLENKVVRSLLGIVLCSGAAAAATMTATTNDVVSRAQGGMYRRHESVRQLLESEEYGLVPADATILTPSLFEPSLTLGFVGGPVLSNRRGAENNYWTGYFRRVGGRRVTVVPRDAQPGFENLYFVRQFQDDLLDDRCPLAFARCLEGVGGALQAKELSFFGARDGFVALLPLVKGGEDVRVRTSHGGEAFVAGDSAFVGMTGSVEGQRVSVEGAEFALDGLSIVEAPRLLQHLRLMLLSESTIAAARNVYEDGWVGPSAAYTLGGSSIPRELVIRGFVPEALRGVRVTVLDGGREIGAYSFDGADGTGAWVQLIEPGPSREIELRSDKFYVPSAEGVNADERELSFVVISLQLRPVG